MKQHDNYDEITTDFENKLLIDGAHMVNAFRIWKKEQRATAALGYLNSVELTPWLHATKLWYNKRKKV